MDARMDAHSPTEARPLGPFSVAPVGLGCMSLSHGYGPAMADDDAVALLRAAADIGYSHFDTAALYADGDNERLVGRALGGRAQLTIATKCGMTTVGGRRVIDGRPQTLAATIDRSLANLGVETIDLLYLHRWDKAVPIADSVGAMAAAVAAGKVRALGLSEVSAATLRAAHAVHPIAAVQTEYSLWTRNPEHGVAAACAELGVALVAFSPLGRGFLAGGPPVLAQGDIRAGMPRFQGDALAANAALFAAFAALAAEAGATPGQLALGWLLARGRHVLAIPATTRAARLHENFAAGSMSFDPGLIARAGALIAPETVTGARYNSATLAEVDTEA